MSQDNKKSFVMYQGDGSNNVFSVPMTKGKFGTISVAFVRRGLSTYQYNPATFTLNSDNTLLTWTGATLNVGDFIVIQRTTTREQPFEFPNNQKHLEKSDDNLERQIQEVADKVDNALLVDPTHAIDSNKMTPLQWMATILRSVDSSVRGFKIVDGILYYSADDPNLPEGSKTWTAVLNTINVTTIREHNNYLEYSVDGGTTWKNISTISVAFENITGNPEDNAVLKNALDAKQDLISDLNAIRSGASKGESSVQPGDLATVATTGAIDDLVNVEITTLSDGQYLRYNAVLGKWQNVSSTASVGFDGITGSPEDNVALKNALDLKANANMDNLTGAGKNISNWSTNVSNCITEIPQDIKLELSSGTLTLKAGSKAYRPNGAGVFTPLTAAADRTVTSTTNGTYMLCSWGMSSIYLVPIANCFSGTTQPSSFSGTGIWYDTTNNVIKATYDGGSTWDGTLVFPMAIITVSDGAISSIDQIFNGFGYIGCCVFTLPGVNGLYPNGRNTDGALKSGAINCTSVQVSSQFNDTANHVLMINPNGKCAWFDTSSFSYNPDTNIMYNSLGVVLSSAVLGTFTTTSGVISNFNPNTVFHAVDYNDTMFIGHQAMPSKESISVTVSASPTIYTTPCDGWFYANALPTASGQFLRLQNLENSMESIVHSGVSGTSVACYLPIKQGDRVRITYNTENTPTAAFVKVVGSAK